MTEKVLFNILFPFYLITLATSVQPAGATGSDISKECRWAEQIVDRRALSGKKQSGRQYLQVRVDGANHFFQGHEDALLRHVIEWLDAHRN